MYWSSRLRALLWEKIVLSWKNYTARFINEYKRKNRDRQEECRSGERHSQRQSQVWQREYWDRFIRNDRHFEAAKNYIVMNPVKAGLVLQPENWLWGSARLRERKLREKIADRLSP